MSGGNLLFDSHCHFDFAAFDSNREEQWQLAQRLGVAGLIIPGVSREQGIRLPAFCRDKPWFYTLGLHPYFLEQHQPDDLRWLEQQLRDDPTVLAVGEIGLDKTLAAGNATQLEQQWQYFKAQVALAQHFGKRLILHIRGMHDEACAFLRQSGFVHGGIVHAFSGSEQQGRAWLALGFKLGIGGAMTHPRAEKLRRTIAALPADAWLLETDSPDMAPAFWASQNNSPSALPVLAACLAALQQRRWSDVINSQEVSLSLLWPVLSATFQANGPDCSVVLSG